MVTINAAVYKIVTNVAEPKIIEFIKKLIFKK